MKIPFIDDTESEHVGDSEKEQNARLHASHAQMLKALNGVVRVADRATDEFDAARAAIEVASEFAEPTKKQQFIELYQWRRIDIPKQTGWFDDSKERAYYSDPDKIEGRTIYVKAIILA